MLVATLVSVGSALVVVVGIDGSVVTVGPDVAAESGVPTGIEPVATGSSVATFPEPLHATVASAVTRMNVGRSCRRVIESPSVEPLRAPIERARTNPSVTKDSYVFYDVQVVNGASAPASLDLTALFDTEADTIFGYLLLRCGSRAVAEDLAGETFLAASRLFSAGRGSEVSPAWLQTVAHRRLVDHWRRSSASRRRFARLVADRRRDEVPAHDPDHRIDRALASLTERQRSVLVLRYLDDRSVSEVAATLDLSYKATESLLSRARASFAAAYEELSDA
jgi:RNA polymerase sigma-70 factor (ECF subfamily)